MLLQCYISMPLLCYATRYYTILYYAAAVFSRIITPPIPPAAQTEISPYLCPVRRRVLARLPTSRPPVAANGWPTAMLEPLGLIFSYHTIGMYVRGNETKRNETKRPVFFVKWEGFLVFVRSLSWQINGMMVDFHEEVQYTKRGGGGVFRSTHPRDGSHRLVLAEPLLRKLHGLQARQRCQDLHTDYGLYHNVTTNKH